MRITRVNVKLSGSGQDYILAYCSVILDRQLVLHDVRIVNTAGGLILSMPSRRVADHCPMCKNKVHLRAAYCDKCGEYLDENRALHNGRKPELFVDVVHPISRDFRREMEDAVFSAYHEEVRKSRLPGYVPGWDGGKITNAIA